MRRWTVGAMAVLLLAVLGGCALRPGGDLGSAALAAAKVKLPGPELGACYTRDDLGDTGTDVGALQAELVSHVACTARHMSETVFVGEFTGADGARTERPAEGSAPLKRAYARCLTGARGYLGADWRQGRLVLLFQPPSGQQWDQGYRYFRCDVGEVRDSRGTVVVRTGSVRGGLSGTRPLAAGCAVVKETADHKDVDNLTVVRCSTAHDAEFAGYSMAPDVPFPANEKEYQRYGSVGCTRTVAAFLGESPGQYEADVRFTWIYVGPGKDDWELGDRAYRCWVFIESGKIHASVKGIGSGPLPH